MRVVYSKVGDMCNKQLIKMKHPIHDYCKASFAVLTPPISKTYPQSDVYGLKKIADGDIIGNSTEVSWEKMVNPMITHIADELEIKLNSLWEYNSKNHVCKNYFIKSGAFIRRNHGSRDEKSFLQSIYVQQVLL